MENIETAILLMVVGMATVFVILLIVIYLGKLLITLVNKYAPEEVVPVKREASQGPAP
ncbi:OadG family protein, partial [Bacteroides ovatus]